MQTDHHEGPTTIVTEQAGDPVGAPVPAHWFAVADFLLLVAKGVVARPVYVPGGEEHGPFLKRIPPRLRGQAAGRFLEPVRAGVTDPRAVVDAVIHNVVERFKGDRAYDLDRALRDALLPGLPESSAIDLEPALDMARWALWWESLPKDERCRIQAERAAQHRQRYIASTTPDQRARQRRKYETTRAVSKLLAGQGGGLKQAREMVDHWVRTGEERWAR